MHWAAEEGEEGRRLIDTILYTHCSTGRQTCRHDPREGLLVAGQTVQPRQNSPYEIRPDNTRSRSRVLCSEGRERARDRENACSPLFLLPKLKWPWPPRDARDFSQRFEPLSSRHDEKRAEGAGAVLGALPAPSRRAMRLAWRLARGGGSDLVMMVTYIMQKETCAAASDLACVGQRVTVSSRECGRPTTHTS